MTSPRRRLIGVAVLAFVIGIGTVLVVINGRHNIHRGAYAALALGIGWGFIGTGLYVWRRRPGNNIGPLMTAVGFSGFLKALAFSNNSAIFTIASLGEVLIYAFLVHLLLSFPPAAWRAGWTVSWSPSLTSTRQWFSWPRSCFGIPPRRAAATAPPIRC